MGRHSLLTISGKTSIGFLLFSLLLTWLGDLAIRSAIRGGAIQVGGSALALPIGAVFLWIVLCLVLSQLFGRHLSRPVKELAQWANVRGMEIPAFTLRRQDEIGSLARSLESMNAEIKMEWTELQDRAQLLETMHRIDGSVLAVESRKELFDEVLEAVLDYMRAHSAAIAIRDPDGGGFDIIAHRKSEGGAAGSGTTDTVSGFFPDGLLSDNSLAKVGDPFEVPLAECDEEMRARLYDDLHERKDELLFANLPLEAKGSYFGSLLVVRDPGGPTLKRAQLLAEQVEVAISDRKAREEGERNWMAVVGSLVRAVDAKSAWTRGHSQRVAALATSMGRKLQMDRQEFQRLEIAAVLHDVGKIGVSESILDKPGKLDESEMECIRRHPALGASIVEDVPSYAEVRSAILYHHERWDGSGYPEGIAGEAIPIAARIIALADVWDAITDERPYRKGMSPDKARAFMSSGSGTMFDPRLLRLFLEVLDQG